MNALVHYDREHLLQLARDKSVAGRRLLLATISDLFFERSDLLNDRQWALMTDILRQLIHEVEVSVRRMLAEHLAKIATAPSELILTLANDDIEVAHPILVQSQVLQDLELIEIIRNRTCEHQLAISLREEISEEVSNALVATANSDVIRSLLENQGARISETTMEYLVEQSRRVDSYQNPLLRRSDLEPRLVNKMYWWVSAALRTYILENFDIDQSALDESLETTIYNLADSSPDPLSKAWELAEEIAKARPITPHLLLSTLKNGEVPLFTALFAKFTGIRSALVNRMLYEPGGEGLCIACRGSGVDRMTFGAMYLLTRKIQKRDEEGPSHVTKILKLYDSMTAESASELLMKWRRDPNFLRAIWQVEQTLCDATPG